MKMELLSKITTVLYQYDSVVYGMDNGPFVGKNIKIRLMTPEHENGLNEMRKKLEALDDVVIMSQNVNSLSFLATIQEVEYEFLVDRMRVNIQGLHSNSAAVEYVRQPLLCLSTMVDFVMDTVYDYVRDGDPMSLFLSCSEKYRHLSINNRVELIGINKLYDNPGLILNAILQHFRYIRLPITHKEVEIDILKNYVEEFEAHNLSIPKFKLKEFFDIIIESDDMVDIVRLIADIGFMDVFIPELSECIGYDQKSMWHDKTLFEHMLETCSVLDSDNKELRIATLFHDIAKPECLTIGDDGRTKFYGHAEASAKLATRILRRFKYDTETVKTVSNYIAFHMRKTSLPNVKAIRKTIRELGGEDKFENLIKLFKADTEAHSKYADKTEFYITLDNIDRLYEEYKSEIEKELNEIKLAITGYDLMDLGYKGKEIKIIKNDLLKIVIEDITRNNKEELLFIVKNRKDKYQRIFKELI